MGSSAPRACTCGEVVVEGDLALPAEGVGQHLGGDEGIAVAIAAHPAAQGEHRGQRRARLRAGQRREVVLEVAVKARHRLHEGVVEVGERVLDLVAHAQLHGPQHPRAPERGDAPPQVRRRPPPAPPAAGPAWSSRASPVGDGELGVEGAAALHLGRVRREDGRHLHPRERGGRLGRRMCPAASRSAKSPRIVEARGAAPASRIARPRRMWCRSSAMLARSEK